MGNNYYDDDVERDIDLDPIDMEEGAPKRKKKETTEPVLGDISLVLNPDKDTEPSGAQWYVVHCYSGQENKVHHAIMQRIETMNMQDKIFDVVVPTEEEIEIKEGKRRTVERRVFPELPRRAVRSEDRRASPACFLNGPRRGLLGSGLSAFARRNR